MSCDPAVLGDELMSTMAAIRRVVRRRLRPTLPGPRLRGAQLELLRIVERRPGTGVAVAAKQLHLAANSVSTLVNQLVGEGMLVRRIDPDDRRAVRLHLTEAAQTRLTSWRAARIELVADAVTQLSTSEQKALASALPVLRTLLGLLDEPDGDRQ